jgi:hypothetical protein
MPLFDRVKSGAAQAVQKAQEAGKAGQAKLDEIQAARHLDALYRELGAAAYAQHAGTGSSDTAATLERLYGEIAAHLEEHAADASATSASESDTPADGGSAPSGDFKLD